MSSAVGPVPPTPIRDALWSLPCVDLAACFGVRDTKAAHAVAVGAVTLREGEEISAADVTDALAAVKPEEQPAYVRVVGKIPVTTWYRPVHTELQAKGIPDGRDGRAFARGDDGSYTELTTKSASP